MPVMREAPEKLFTKCIVSKGYGFHTPQDGSVCKIKIMYDEVNLLSGLNEDQTKEIIVGDVDEPVDRIIEDCIRQMKEEEECYIEFQHPNVNTDMIILVDNSSISEDKQEATNANVDDCFENIKDSKAEVNCSINSTIDSDSESFNVQLEKPEEESKNILDLLKKEDKTICSISATDVINIEDEKNKSVYMSSKLPNIIKIQMQLLSYTREPEIWEMSITEKWRRASYHKQRGLELYARGIYQYAFRRFGLTLKYVISLEHDVPSGQEEGMDIKGLKLSCYLNVAACQMRHHNFESVVINSSKALNLQPSNAKALYRRGAAYLQLQEYEKAKEDLTSAQQLEPKNQAIAKQLEMLKSRVQKLNQYYASAMKKMFS